VDRGLLLTALERFRDISPQITLNQVVTYLYVAENEGLSIQDLQHRLRTTQTTASRTVRSLGDAGGGWALPPALGLIEAFAAADDGRRHVLFLSEAGRALATRLGEGVATSATGLRSLESRAN